jgi:Mn2+/Fe2+ NRAMP family transporter
MSRLFPIKGSSPIVAAAFLMATSAIGPGFLTQTAVFTRQLLTSFGFVILISILLDVGAQLNIWRIVTMRGKPAQEIVNDLLPGAGHLLTLMITIGGLAFNTGNLAGAGLGLSALFDMDVKVGAIASAVIALALFLSGNMLGWLDRFARVLGFLMIGLTCYVVFVSNPPVGEAIYRSFVPERVDMTAILTLVGGTVGGYISFSGAHRLLDAGMRGSSCQSDVRRSAVSAILLASVMRILLFLAALGAIYGGLQPGTENPAAMVFRHSAGMIGYRIFGLVMWSAAITSVVGSAYTTISFLRTMHPVISAHQRLVLVVFVLISLVIFMWVGQPVNILVYAGALNGFILPFSLGMMLIAVRLSDASQLSRHPRWLSVAGWIVVLATGWMGVRAILLLIG